MLATNIVTKLAGVYIMHVVSTWKVTSSATLNHHIWSLAEKSPVTPNPRVATSTDNRHNKSSGGVGKDVSLVHPLDMSLNPTDVKTMSKARHY